MFALELTTSQAILACPKCKRSLNDSDCHRCGEFPRNKFGYLQFDWKLPADETFDFEAGYARDQVPLVKRLWSDYIKPSLETESFNRLLDVGCGGGTGVELMLTSGYDAYGIDLPEVSAFWREANRDPSRFFVASGEQLPFASESFDAVTSTGVIEHIGEMLSPTERGRARARYASEILRVTRSGGRILIACPNKTFPVDLQHAPPLGYEGWRRSLFNKTRLHFHPTWGPNHLLSYSEVCKLFKFAHSFEPLPLKGYFGFEAFNGALKPVKKIAEGYLNHLPKLFRGTCLSPYTLAMVRK